MTLLRFDDPPELIRIRRGIDRSRIWRWLEPAGIYRDDIAILVRLYDDQREEIMALRATLASMADGLPAALEMGEQPENLSNFKDAADGGSDAT